MKNLILASLILLSLKSFATVDGATNITLVTYDYNEGEYMVKTYPTEGCYGVEHGPQAAVFAKAFMVTAGMGCGMPGKPQNVNVLSCAKAEYKWDEDSSKVLKITLDIAKCSDNGMENHRQKFSAAIVAAARANFGAAVEVEVVGHAKKL